MPINGLLACVALGLMAALGGRIAWPMRGDSIQKTVWVVLFALILLPVFTGWGGVAAAAWQAFVAGALIGEKITPRIIVVIRSILDRRKPDQKNDSAQKNKVKTKDRPKSK